MRRTKLGSHFWRAKTKPESLHKLAHPKNPPQPLDFPRLGCYDVSIIQKAEMGTKPRKVHREERHGCKRSVGTRHDHPGAAL